MQRNVSPVTAVIIILVALGLSALAWVRLSTGPKPMTDQERSRSRQGASARRGGGGGRRGGGGGRRGGGGGRRGASRRGGASDRGGSGGGTAQAKPGGPSAAEKPAAEKPKSAATK